MSLKRSIKVLGLVLAAACAISVVVAGAAQANAPRWTITEGATAKTLTAAESRAFTAKSTTETVLRQGAVGSAIELKSAAGECTAVGSIVGSAAGSPGKNKEVILTCKGVKVFNKNIEQPACGAKSPGAPAGTIVTNKLESTLVWEQTNSSEDTLVGDTFVNEENTATGLFSTVELTGEACAIASKLNITGNTICTVEPVTTHVTTGILNCPAEGNKVYFTNQTPDRTKDEDAGLKLGAAPSTFTGKFNITLNSDELFGVEPG